MASQSHDRWDLWADTVPTTPALHHLCKLGKCRSLGSSSQFCLLTRTSANMCKQCTSKCSTHALAPESKAWPQPKGASYGLQLGSAVRYIPAPLLHHRLEQPAPAAHVQGQPDYPNPATHGIFMQLFSKRYIFASVECNCSRYGSVSYCFLEMTLSFKGVQLGNLLQQWGPSWEGARAEAGRAAPLQLRAEWGLGLPNPLLAQSVNGIIH